MKITVLTPERLTTTHFEMWSRWQRAEKAVASPFFRPEYVQAVAAVRSDVAVAVMEDKGEPVGFFPFQRGPWGTGKPVGGRMTDYQGVVARPGFEWNAQELIRGCGLAVWDFDNLAACQQPFHSHHYRTVESHYLDLSQGFDAYQADRVKAGSLVVKQVLRRARKLARQVGPLRLDLHTTDSHVLNTLIRWKSEQYVRTQVTNIFAYPWTARLLEQVVGQSAEPFSGMLTALYAGPHLVAVHLGIRSYGVMHWWFPTYDREFARYSPGLILLMEFSRAAPSLGIHRIDLGKGEANFKLRLASGSIPVAEGSVAVPVMHRFLRRGWHHFRSWIRSSPLRGTVQLVGRWARPVRGWLAFH